MDKTRTTPMKDRYVSGLSGLQTVWLRCLRLSVDRTGRVVIRLNRRSMRAIHLLNWIIKRYSYVFKKYPKSWNIYAREVADEQHIKRYGRGSWDIVERYAEIQRDKPLCVQLKLLRFFILPALAIGFWFSSLQQSDRYQRPTKKNKMISVRIFTPMRSWKGDER